jgi:kynurenine formamidase
VRLGEGDIFVFRTGHHRRRLELGAWDNGYPPAGQGKPGLHVDTIGWMHERRIAAFLPDGDGETVPSNVEGMLYPIHPLQVTAMGMFVSDSLQLEDLARACAEEGRFEFMVVGLPLRLPGGTGSPWNPIAIFLTLRRRAHGPTFRRQGGARDRGGDRHGAGDRRAPGR